MVNDLIVVRPEAPHLVPILDREMPTFCECCGTEVAELFNSGKYMSCVQCSKDARIARKLGVRMPDPGMRFTDFMEALEKQGRFTFGIS